jgi:hypothetical protein
MIATGSHKSAVNQYEDFVYINRVHVSPRKLWNAQKADDIRPLQKPPNAPCTLA